MPFAPTTPFPKSRGDLIRAQDWNDLVNEVERLGTAKVTRAGDSMTGPLTITGDVGNDPQVGADVAGVRIEGGEARPNAGYLRFGDNSGWKLHFGRSREQAQGPLNAGPAGVLLTLQDNGNVGIGTSAPIAPLDVRSIPRTGTHPTAVKGLYVTGDFSADHDGVEFRLSNGTQGIGFGYNTLYATGTNPDQHLNLLPRGAGNVGIGTTSPTAKLTVDPGGEGGIVIGNPSTNTGGWTSLMMHITAARDGRARLQAIKAAGTAWGDLLLNPSGGNVGIGVTEPVHRLQLGQDHAGVGLDSSDGSPNAGYIRFGDGTGWKLHIGRSREHPGSPVNTGTSGVLMTVEDNGAISIAQSLSVKGAPFQFVQSGEWNAGALQGVQTKTLAVTFGRAFAAPPTVVTGVRYLDVNKDMNTRYQVTVTALTATGFTLQIMCWADTQIYGIIATWVAYGAPG